MARWRRQETARFEDMPAELRFKSDQEPGVVDARHRWLEEHGLSLVDYLGWERSFSPHAPARRSGPLPPDVLRAIAAEEE